MAHGWRVHPAGVEAVGTATIGAADPIWQAETPLQRATGSVRTGGASDLVSGALDAFFEFATPKMRFVEERVPAALGGLKQTAEAIGAGDDAMAERIDGFAAAGFAGYTPPPLGGR